MTIRVRYVWEGLVLSLLLWREFRAACLLDGENLRGFEVEKSQSGFGQRRFSLRGVWFLGCGGCWRLFSSCAWEWHESFFCGLIT